MKIVMFYHSLVSDWNHGNAHFLRGVMRELLARGCDVALYEPRDGWSRANLIKYQGEDAVDAFHTAYPELRSTFYDEHDLDLDAALAGADGVIVHEWTPPELVAAVGAHRARSPRSYRLLFHDTHHRSASAPEEMARYDLSNYDGALVFGEVVREIYLERGWARDAWTWHEAADVSHYRPLPDVERDADLVWIGNWGDDERKDELETFLFRPVERLALHAAVHGVQYPPEALRRLDAADIAYRGWASAADVVREYARHRMTVHVPRRYYAEALPGIPTIRVFEALACGVPLICAPWSDAEGLFTPGADYLVARDGEEMAAHMRRLRDHPEEAVRLARHGLRTIHARHTCAHRVDELMNILRDLGADAAALAPASPGAHA